MNYNELAQQIYAQNKAVGWWDNPDRCLYECLQLVSTEVAEATEAERKDLMDDHLPHRKGGEVELADALIRVLDLGAHLGLEHQGEMGSFHRFDYGKQSVGAIHLAVNRRIIDLSEAIFWSGSTFARDNCNSEYSDLIATIGSVAAHFGYDLEAATTEKLAYNKTRADHKRENRAQAGGKKF